MWGEVTGHCYAIMFSPELHRGTDLMCIYYYSWELRKKNCSKETLETCFIPNACSWIFVVPVLKPISFWVLPNACNWIFVMPVLKPISFEVI